jgi:hypothetical protein
VRLNAFRTNLDDLGLMLTNDRAIPFDVVIFLMTTSLATMFIVVWSLLASLTLGFAQEFESFPDAEITGDHWQQRVQDARRRSEQFVARARTRVPEPLSTDKEEAEASDQRAMNDASLQRGDIISTSKGFFRFVGGDNDGRQASDFLPLPNPQPPAAAGHAATRR